MLKPLHDHVVIEPVEIEKKTASGIILSGDAAKPTHSEGTVVALGPGKLVEGKRAPLSVEVGQKVIYGGYSQSKVTHEEKEYVIVSEQDIVAIVE